jgi:hypothetical protein
MTTSCSPSSPRPGITNGTRRRAGWRRSFRYVPIFEIGGSRSDERLGRTAGEILGRAAILAVERKKKEAERRAIERARRERVEAEAREKRLQSLAGKENELWMRVDRLIATKQPRRYDEAVSLLQDLHDLAELQRKGPDFKFRIGALQRENSGKSSLMERFRRAKFLGG